MALEKLQVKIGGMACSFCVETVKKGLGRTEGVEEVNVSVVTMRNGDGGRATIEEAITRIGHVVAEK